MQARTSFLVTSLTAGLLVGVTVAEPPAKPEPKVERITYRVTGLFASDREKGLRAGFEELTDFN